MKFQNPSFKIFFERTDGHTSRKQYAPHFFKVGGITSAEDCFRKMKKVHISGIKKSRNKHDFLYFQHTMG